MALGKTGRYAVAQAGQQASHDGPGARQAIGIGLEAGFIPGQQRNASKAEQQPDDARAVRSVLQPDPGHQRAKQGDGGVQNRRQPGADGQQGIAKAGEGQGRIEQAHEEHLLPMRCKLWPESTPQQQGQQEQGGDHHAQTCRGQRPKFLGTQAHEEEGRTPERRQQQELAEPGFGGVSWVQRTPSSCSRALLRSSPPA